MKQTGNEEASHLEFEGFEMVRDKVDSEPDHAAQPFGKLAILRRVEGFQACHKGQIRGYVILNQIGLLLCP